MTGNGSITNFPFVPTVKIVTTTRRFELLQHDMDINAGKYLDGMSMDELGIETLQYTLDVASGVKSVGEKAGHSQVQLWRNWRQPDGGMNPSQSKIDLSDTALSGIPLRVDAAFNLPGIILNTYASPQGKSFERIGLLLPTSLCSGQVARMAADKLNAKISLMEWGIDRFVPLVHTEGCGASSGASEALYMRTMVGHLTHPSVSAALFLEHGCEKTHNDYFRNYLNDAGINPMQFGWASIQRDGGIQAALENIENWAQKLTQVLNAQKKKTSNVSCIRLGILVDPGCSHSLIAEIAKMISWLVGQGGSVLWLNDEPEMEYRDILVESLLLNQWSPTLAYAQQLITSGFHLVAMHSQNWQERVTGLGASGVNLLLYLGNDATRPGHPFIPMIQVASGAELGDADLDYSVDKPGFVKRLQQKIADTLHREYAPTRMKVNNDDFQITRGLYGISL